MNSISFWGDVAAAFMVIIIVILQILLSAGYGSNDYPTPHWAIALTWLFFGLPYFLKPIIAKMMVWRQ